MINRYLCQCGEIATWCLMSGYGFYCENCVPRSCTCNHNFADFELPPIDEIEGKDWKWVNDEIGKFWVSLDEQGREYPCCEFDYQKEGYDRD